MDSRSNPALSCSNILTAGGAVFADITVTALRFLVATTGTAWLCFVDAGTESSPTDASRAGDAVLPRQRWLGQDVDGNAARSLRRKHRTTTQR